MRSGCVADLHPIYRHLLAMTLDELEVMEAHLRQLDEELAQLLRVHQDAIQRLAAVPGLGGRFHATNHRGSGSDGRRVCQARSAY